MTGWIAAALFLLGGFVIEYAQGVWAHGLSLGLVMTSIYAAARAREGDATRWAALAGLAVGIAAGVRYQNAAMACLIGLGIVLFSAKRLRNGLAYAAGAGLPVAVSSLINHARYGYWNPISKGPGYLGASSSRGWRAFPEALHATWDRIVDASSHPAFGDSLHQMNLVLPKDPDTGAFFVLGVVRKSLFQSSPWFALALVALLLVWFARVPVTSSQRRETRAASLVVFGMLTVFAYFGLKRTEGWAFNQRYMLDIMPIAAVCAAWWLERFETKKWVLGVGVVVGGLATGAVLWAPIASTTGRTLLILTLPVLMAGLIIVLALGAGLEKAAPSVARFSGKLLPAVAAASLAWAFLVHLGEDVRASRERRQSHLQQANTVEEALPNKPVALVVYWGSRDPFGGILLSRDAVLIDTWVDNGKDYDEMVERIAKAGSNGVHRSNASIHRRKPRWQARRTPSDVSGQACRNRAHSVVSSFAQKRAEVQNRLL